MSSAAPSFPSTKQANNYERLCRLLVDVGWQVLRGTFDRVRPPGSLHSVLADSKIHTQLKSLQKKRVLSTPQWRKLYPVIKSSVSSRDFDSTLLVILLRNICDLFPPATGWSNCPLVTDTTLAADIARIQFYRNTVYSHASNASVDDAAFSSYWKEIKDTLVRLGGACYGDAIDNFKNEIMGLEFEGHYQELLKQWVEGDNSIEDKLEEDDRDKKQRKLNDSEESSEDSKRSTEIDETETESLECPPQLSVKIPKKSELPPNSRPWSTVELPIDILLMTVEDDEFLSCFSYLEKPFKSYHSSIGPVYFGSIGNEHGKKRKIGLMKCSKGSADPGSSLPAVQNAVRVLRPRAVFSVGACSGLNCKKTRLGDVVVSAKLITPSYKTPPGRGIGNLRRHISDGWKPPLEKPDHRDVEVHCDGVVLSIQKSDGGWPYEEIIQRYPEATAVEMEGGGRWVKIDSHQVPKEFFGYFIAKLGVQVNAVRQVRHRAQPCYQSATLKVSYKLFHLDQLLSALEEQPIVSPHRELLFEGNEISNAGHEGNLSAEDEIARAKARVYTPAGNKRRRPSSKSSLQVGLGEGRATREVEIIWWPNLYTVTEHGQMIIRMYIHKCDF